MTRIRLVCCIVGMIAAGTAAAVRAQIPVFRSGVDGITIHVSVRGGNKPVAGLTAGDFALLDNGVPQTISSLSAAEIPVDVTLLLDLSSSVDGPLLEKLKAGVRDTAALLRGGDRIRLVAISQVLREVFGFRARGEQMPLDGLQASGATSLFDGLAATMMEPPEPGRRQLTIAFTDGRDSTSITDETTAKEIARLTETVVHVVVPRREEGNPAISSLTALVAPTAGRVMSLDAGASVSRAFRRMLDDFRAGYVLQYVPRGVRAAGWHDVAVSVTKPGNYEVRARKGYRGQE